MIAEAQNLVADVGDVGGNVGGIGAVVGIGLEELVPHQDAVLVAELVEIFAGALAYPVANHVEMGELMQVDLGIETLAGNALHGFIESPVAAANEDRNAVDGDGEGVGAGNAVGDFANAEIDILRIGDVVLDVDAEMEMVEILRAVAVGPPEPRMLNVQRGRVLGIEGDELCAVRSEFDWTAGRRFSRSCLGRPLFAACR